MPTWEGETTLSSFNQNKFAHLSRENGKRFHHSHALAPGLPSGGELEYNGRDDSHARIRRKKRCSVISAICDQVYDHFFSAPADLS